MKTNPLTRFWRGFLKAFRAGGRKRARAKQRKTQPTILPEVVPTCPQFVPKPKRERRKLQGPRITRETVLDTIQRLGADVTVREIVKVILDREPESYLHQVSSQVQELVRAGEIVVSRPSGWNQPALYSINKTDSNGSEPLTEKEKTFNHG